MNLSDHVTSLELSKCLKELGVKQESQFYYCNAKSIGDHILENEIWMIAHLSQTTGLSKDWYSAFLASELLEMLPTFVEGYNQLTIQKWYPTGYETFYSCSRTELGFDSKDQNLCNSLAKMLIHLIENKLIEV